MDVVNVVLVAGLCVVQEDALNATFTPFVDLFGEQERKLMVNNV